MLEGVKRIPCEIPAERQAYFLEGGRLGILYLHGFMGSPKSSRPLAEWLNAQGLTVSCPLLPGHGHLPARLAGYNQHDWLATAESAYQNLSRKCDDIFVIGHSMGSVLSAHLATRTTGLRGMVALAPLYHVPRRSVNLMRFLRYVKPWLYPIKDRILRRELVEQRLLEFNPELDLTAPDVEQWIHEETKVPTAAVDEMRKMAALGRSLWPRIALPIVVLQGGHDEAVAPDHALTLFKKISATDKAIHTFPTGSHELMRDFDPNHQAVWSIIHTFIESRSDERVN